MTTASGPSAEPRAPLSKERVVQAAVRLADTFSLEAVSMRRVGQELEVEGMALYNHVANKDDLLDGMVDLVISEITPPATDADWKTAIRGRALAAREVLMRHPWAPRVIQSRTDPTPAVLAYLDACLGILRRGGLSLELTHYALHALGSRLLGFTQELWEESGSPAARSQLEVAMLRERLAPYPSLAAMLEAGSHDQASILGQGCDDQAEFEFALDLILDGLERQRDRH